MLATSFKSIPVADHEILMDFIRGKNISISGDAGVRIFILYCLNHLTYQSGRRATSASSDSEEETKRRKRSTRRGVQEVRMKMFAAIEHDEVSALTSSIHFGLVSLLFISHQFLIFISSDPDGDSLLHSEFSVLSFALILQDDSEDESDVDFGKAGEAETSSSASSDDSVDYGSQDGVSRCWRFCLCFVLFRRG